MPSSQWKDLMKQYLSAAATGAAEEPMSVMRRNINANRDVVNSQQMRINALETGMALRDRALMEANSAKLYVEERLHSLLLNVQQTSSAIHEAGREYDRILNIQASKPLFGEIFFNLLITLIPFAKPLGVLGRIAPSFTDATLGKKGIRYLDAVDGKIDDLIGSFRGPISSSSLLASDQLTANIKATVVSLAIQSELADLFEYAQKVVGISTKMYRYIEKTRIDIVEGRQTDVYIRAKVESLFKTYGLDKMKTVGGAEFTKLCSLMLYCMLRKYTEQHVRFSFPNYSPGGSNALLNRKISDLPHSWPEDCIEGLNDLQRKAIYQRFGSIWFSSKPTMLAQLLTMSDLVQYPAIYDYRDILRFWKKGKIFEFTIYYDKLRNAKSKIKEITLI